MCLFYKLTLFTTGGDMKGFQRTLLIIKPDAMLRRVAGKIITRIEDKGLFIAGMKQMKITKALASKHYAEHKGKGFYNSLLNFITSAPVIVMCVEGVDAVDVCRGVVGATNGRKAAPGTIRGDFGMSGSNNLIHASDSVKSGKREVGLFFNKSELVSYKKEDVVLHYDITGDSPF